MGRVKASVAVLLAAALTLAVSDGICADSRAAPDLIMKDGQIVPAQTSRPNDFSATVQGKGGTVGVGLGVAMQEGPVLETMLWGGGGAIVGSVAGPPGTLIGAAVGSVAGLIVGLIMKHRIRSKDFRGH